MNKIIYALLFTFLATFLTLLFIYFYVNVYLVIIPKLNILFTISNFYVIFSFLISLYFFISKKYHKIMNKELIYEYKKNKKELYHIHFLFLDIIFVFKNYPILSTILFFILFYSIKIILKIIIIRMLSSIIWTIHYFCLINKNKILGVEFEYKVDLSFYNYFWLKKKNLIVLYLFKIPQLNGFLINYILENKKTKKKESIEIFKKNVYYKFLGIPIKIFVSTLKLIIFLEEIIKKVKWKEKKKKKWISILLYEIKWNLPQKLNEEYSEFIFWTSNMKIKNKKSNNGYMIVMQKISYIHFIKKKNNFIYSKFIRNERDIIYERNHCALVEKSKNTDEFSIAITKTHSEEIKKEGIKVKQLLKEINEEKNGSNNQFSYAAVIPQTKILGGECSNAFKMNNKIYNYAVEEAMRNRDLMVAGIVLEKEDNIISHEKDMLEIIKLNDIIGKKLGYASEKFIKEDMIQMKEELENIIKKEFPDISKEEFEALKTKIIEKLKNISKSDFIELGLEEAIRVNDKESVETLEIFKNFEKEKRDMF